MRQETGSRAPEARPRGGARRALVAIGAAIVVAMAATAIHRRIEDGRHLRTGRAEWIWYERAGRLPKPLRFYAFRDWDLSVPPARARALVFADPGAALSVNGARVADLKQRAGDAFESVDLAPHLKAGTNRIVFEASSADGIGGLLFAVEGDGLDPDAVASGRSWRVTLDPKEAEKGIGRPAVVWGRPPQYPWGYPAPAGPGR